MQETGTLFGAGELPARTFDQPTARQAAVAMVKSGQRALLQKRVLTVVQTHPGLTSRELAKAIAAKYAVSELIGYDMAHKRLPELRKHGLVANGERRACAVTGMNAMTWVALTQEVPTP